MDILLGVVTKIEDPDKFVIRFSVQDIIQDIVAYPFGAIDQPELGDPIVIYGIESILGYSYLYEKLRVNDYTRIKLGNSNISVTKDYVSIITDGGNDILISSDGSVNIKSKGSINIESDTKITVDAPQIKFPSGIVGGDVSGPFNRIPVCPFTGQPHSGNLLIGK